MDKQVLTIQQNMERIRERMVRAAHSCGRNPGGIRLMVVTKTQPIETVRAAIEAGADHLGENYAEEAQPKIAQLREEGYAPLWHMIGHVQSRKAKIVSADFDMLHSLDSLSLAEKLERNLAVSDRLLPVLMEVNVGGEESKGGWAFQTDTDLDRIAEAVEVIGGFAHLKLVGLMTMPPYREEGEGSRPFFRKLKALRDALENRFPRLDLSELSMGTSSDFEVAIQEGATYVRIGTAILGPRKYPARTGDAV